MNTRPEWIKYRAHSAPLPSTPSHSRSQSRSVATALDKLKIQSKKRYAHDKKLERASSRLQFLMPRVEIIDDTNQTNLIVKLEIPDVNPSDVHLKLHGTLLSIYGERQPDLSAVREEYRDGLRFHSQTRMDGNHSPSVILLGRGRVASFLSNQVHVPSKQQQQPAPQPPSSPPQGRTRAERVHYSELRYGAFCRNLRVPQGTMTSDIEGSFINGMLVLSWPRTSAHAEAENSSPPASGNITIPIAPVTPLTVKVVESGNTMEVDLQQ